MTQVKERLFALPPKMPNRAELELLMPIFRAARELEEESLWQLSPRSHLAADCQACAVDLLYVYSPEQPNLNLRAVCPLCGSSVGPEVRCNLSASPRLIALTDRRKHKLHAGLEALEYVEKRLRRTPRNNSPRNDSPRHNSALNLSRRNSSPS